MSKYQKLYSLFENLYAEGAPLIIAAGALQKDTENGSVFAQIKFKNIDNRTIKAVRVVISAFDDFGKELGDKEYLYQDISARRDDEFGQKMPVVLDNATRSFNVKVSEVAFEDGSKWTDNGTELKSIEKQEAINSLLKEQELIKQYHIKYGDFCEYVAKTDRDLVLCSCGAVNKQNEGKCHKCGSTLAKLVSLDIDALTKEKDTRLANEAKAAEEKRIAEEKAAEETKKRAKKAAKIAGIVAACVAVCVGLALLTVKVIVPTVKYNNAVKMMNNEQYEEAITAFEALDGYKDSAEQISDCQEAIKERDYNAAVELMKNEQYEEAIAAFEALKGYKNSNENIVFCENEPDYIAAVELMNNAEFQRAKAEFEKIKDYKDSSGKISECETALKDIAYNAAVELMNEKQYEKAIDEFGKLGKYKDSKDKKRQCQLDLAEQYLQNNDMVSAISYYGDARENDKMREVEYKYVLSHNNNEDFHTLSYLSDLKSVGYKDSDEIYKELYDWKIEVRIYDSNRIDIPAVNDSIIHEYEHKISDGVPVCSVKVTGGKPGEKISLFFEHERILGDPHTNKEYPGANWSSSEYMNHTDTFSSSPEWQGPYRLTNGSNVIRSKITVSNSKTKEVYASHIVTIIHHWD